MQSFIERKNRRFRFWRLPMAIASQDIGRIGFKSGRSQTYFMALTRAFSRDL
jgi:hypothetical protein